MHRHLLALLALLVLLLSLFPGTVSATEGPFSVDVSAPRLLPGEPGAIEVVLHVPEGHRLYRDSISVEVLDDGGLALGAPELPAGTLHPDPANPGRSRLIYDHDVYITVPFRAPQAQGSYQASLRIHSQGCDHAVCLLPQALQRSASVIVSASLGAEDCEPDRALVNALGGAEAAPDPVHPRAAEVLPGFATVTVQVDEPWHVNKAFMGLVFPEGSPLAQDDRWSIGDLVLPEGTPFVDEASGFERVDLGGTFDFKAPITGPDGLWKVDVEVGYQSCKAELCLIPTWKPLAVVVPLGEAGAQALANGDEPVAAGATAPAPAVQDPADAGPADPAPPVGGDDALSVARSAGVLPLILLVFLAGIGVSFTPCVLPMVPITIGVIGARAAGNRGKAVALSGAYVLGMALVYTTLGVAAGFTGMMFGSWLQNPWVVSAIAGLFFVMGLAMFGLFDIGMPSAVQTRLSRYGGAGFGGALVVGMVGALVAGPCSGPVLVSIITLIGQQGEVLLGALLMMVFSLGMGVIFLVAGAFSSTLLRPGPWMDTVKKSFGLIMWAGAVYFISPQLSVGWTALLAATLLLITAVFTWPSEEAGEGYWMTRTRVLYSLVAGILGAYLLIGLLLSRGFILGPVPLQAGGATVIEESGLAWGVDEVTASRRAADEGKIMMIDFTADWCAACQELEHLTYTEPAVIEAADDMVLVMVDATRNDDPAVKALLDKYEVKGLPTVKFVKPSGEPIEELTVTGFLEATEFKGRMERAKDTLK